MILQFGLGVWERMRLKCLLMNLNCGCWMTLELLRGTWPADFSVIYQLRGLKTHMFNLSGGLAEDHIRSLCCELTIEMYGWKFDWKSRKTTAWSDESVFISRLQIWRQLHWPVWVFHNHSFLFSNGCFQQDNATCHSLNRFNGSVNGKLRNCRENVSFYTQQNLKGRILMSYLKSLQKWDCLLLC